MSNRAADIARSASVPLLDSLPHVSVLWAGCQPRVVVSISFERNVTGLLVEVVDSAARVCLCIVYKSSRCSLCSLELYSRSSACAAP